MQCGKPTLRYRAGQAACTTSMHKQGCTTNMLNKHAQHACVTPGTIPSTTSMQDIKHKTTHNKHACRACMTSAQHHARHHAQHYRHSVLRAHLLPPAWCLKYSNAALQKKLKRLASSFLPYTQPTQNMPLQGSRKVVFRPSTRPCHTFTWVLFQKKSPDWLNSCTCILAMYT